MEVAGKPTPVATVLCPAGEGGAGTYAEARRSPTPPAVPAEPDQLDCGADICPQAVKLDVLASDSVTGTEFEGMVSSYPLFKPKSVTAEVVQSM